MSAGSSQVFSVEGLRKQRAGARSTFELLVPRLTLRAGQVIVLAGASGCGKSTLLDLLAMVLRPDACDRFVFSPQGAKPLDLGALWSMNELDQLADARRVHLGYVLQFGGLLSFLTVRENIALAAELVGRRRSARVEHLAEGLGIYALLDEYPTHISVGERQRAAVARALAHRPTVILADEPTASVDPPNADKILKLLLDEVERLGASAVIASHDWARVRDLEHVEHRISEEGDVTRALFWTQD